MPFLFWSRGFHTALIALAALCVVALSAPTSQFYVDGSAGSDSGSGTQAAPFRTLTRAQAAVRSVNAAMLSDVSVFVRAGTYAQTAPLTFGPADSGVSSSAVVRWVGGWPSDAPGAPAVIHAGAQVTGWHQVDAGRNIWAAPLPAGVEDARQLWKDGARVPASTAGGLGSSVTETSTGYTAAAANVPWLAAPPSQQAASDVEFLYTGVGSRCVGLARCAPFVLCPFSPHPFPTPPLRPSSLAPPSWTECRLRVASVEVTGGVANITMAQPAWSLHGRAYGQGLPKPVSTENLYATLTPGTRYISGTSHTVFYAAAASDNMATATFIVPALDVLMLVAGDESTSVPSPVRWLSFEGLTFSYAGWIVPNNGLGYVDMQSGYRLTDPHADPSNDDLWAPVPGNVQVHASENVTFAGCAFKSLGATALAILDSSQSSTVVNNTFTDVSCSGVALGQVSDVNITAARENGYHNVVGNLFENIPVEFHDCAPVLGGYVVGSTIANNAIVNASNGGICLGWGWSRDEAVNAGWNSIVRNYVYRSNYLLEDCGSIYVLGPQPASLMANNFLSGQVKLFGAL